VDYLYKSGILVSMSSHTTEITLARVEAYCQKHGSRFTIQRKAVLEVISNSTTPLGAYDILEQLRTTLNNPKPPTIYRAISFLEQHHFIHRIESLNAYVMCDTDHRHSGAQFLICDSCSNVTEIHQCTLPKALTEYAKNADFTPSYWISELHGQCKDCQKA